MENTLYNPHDHIDYAKSDPNERQSIYFGVDGDWYSRMFDIMLAEAKKTRQEGLVELGPVLDCILRAITTQCPQMTLPQLLSVVHMISYDLGHKGGFMSGVEAKLELLLQSQQSAPTASSFKTPIATA